VLLGTTSSSFALFNILCLSTSRKDMQCCREISRFSCFAGLLGILQVAAQQACFSLIMFLFLIFFPRESPTSSNHDASSAPTWRTALLVVLTCGIHYTVLLLTSAILLLWWPEALSRWATGLGVCAAILACIQYLPQLRTTWKLGNVMSLSIPMMCIQTPGSFLFAASLAVRLGWEGASTWGVYVLTGLLQGCLLAMGITFEVRDRRKQKQLERQRRGSNANGGGIADERTALLG